MEVYGRFYVPRKGEVKVREMDLGGNKVYQARLRAVSDGVWVTLRRWAVDRDRLEGEVREILAAGWVVVWGPLVKVFPYRRNGGEVLVEVEVQVNGWKKAGVKAPHSEE